MFDKGLLEYVGLLYILDLSVRLVHLFGLDKSRGSEPFLLLALFNQSTPICLKVMGWGGGGPCDFSVSPSPFGLDFGTLDFGLGLDKSLVVQF